MDETNERLSDVLRQAVEHSRLSRYRIAQLTGIDESTLGKFAKGQRGLSLDAVDRLAECLGLQFWVAGPEND